MGKPVQQFIKQWGGNGFLHPQQQLTYSSSLAM